jgi:NCS2 family nucleobase:cation symporter-2
MAERPKDLVYARDETPPPLPLVAIGFQHVAVICPYLVMVALVAGAGKLSHRDATSAMGLAMLAVAFLTVLQSRRLGPVGSGYLCPPVVSAIYLPSAMSAAAAFGFPVVCGMVMFAGACEIAVGRLTTALRKFFPAVVSGVVIMAVGVELGKIGAGVLFAREVAHDPRAAAMLAAAFAVLATMVGLAVWGRGLPKLLCLLAGIVVGYALAALLGLFPADFAGRLAATPVFALPDPRFLSWGFEASLMLPFAVAGLASGLRAVGVLTTCQQIDDAAWRRPEMKSISGGVVADGLGCAVGGALGTPGMSASPSLVGIARITGVTSRTVAWSIAAWLVAFACLPKVASLIIDMPKPVMAAALFFNGALMLVAGIQIAVSRPITLRASLIIGFSVLASIAVMVFRSTVDTWPAWTHPIAGSEITVAVVVAVALNALFLLGTWRTSVVRLGGGDAALTPAAFDAFFAARAAEWKLPADDAHRVRAVVDEAIERVGAQARGPVTIEVGSDEYEIAVRLRYSGNLPDLPDARPRLDLVEEQSFVSGLTGYLSGLHADRIDRSAEGEACEVRLLFRL